MILRKKLDLTNLNGYEFTGELGDSIFWDFHIAVSYSLSPSIAIFVDGTIESSFEGVSFIRQVKTTTRTEFPPFDISEGGSVMNTITSPTMKYYYISSLDNSPLVASKILLAPGFTRIVEPGNHVFLALGTCSINGVEFVAPTQISINTVPIEITAVTEIFAVQIEK